MSDYKEEKSIITAFYNGPHRQKLLALVQQQQQRDAFIEALLDDKELEDGCVRTIPGSDALSDKIFELLSALGAPAQCYVISENEELDGRTVSLKHALDEIVESGDAAILSCLPGKLAYFEGCMIGQHLLLKR